MQVRRSWFGEGSEQIMTEREQAEMHRRSPFSSVLIIIQLFWIMEELRSLPWTSFHTKADLDNISLSKICILPTQVPFVYFIKPSTTPIVILGPAGGWPTLLICVSLLPNLFFYFPSPTQSSLVVLIFVVVFVVFMRACRNRFILHYHADVILYPVNMC